MKTETLDITVDNAFTAYDKGTPEDKALLENLFPGFIFSRKITDRVQSWEAVLRIKGITQADFEALVKGLRPHEVGNRRLETLYEVLNEGWVPDWTNSSQPKYYAWMKYVSGSGFRFFDFDGTHTSASVGPRLYLRSSELVIHVSEYFPDLLNEYYNN